MENSSYYTPKERGGCLTAWLIFIFIANGILILLSLSISAIIGVIAGIFTLICAVGLWNWQKWGYFGIMVGYVVGIGAALLIEQNLASVIGGAIGITITYALVHERIGEFE